MGFRSPEEEGEQNQGSSVPPTPSKALPTGDIPRWGLCILLALQQRSAGRRPQHHCYPWNILVKGIRITSCLTSAKASNQNPSFVSH